MPCGAVPVALFAAIWYNESAEPDGTALILYHIMAKRAMGANAEILRYRSMGVSMEAGTARYHIMAKRAMGANAEFLRYRFMGVSMEAGTARCHIMAKRAMGANAEILRYRFMGVSMEAGTARKKHRSRNGYSGGRCRCVSYALRHDKTQLMISQLRFGKK